LTSAGGYFFAKYHALGNDMLVIDPARWSLPLTPARIRTLCDRHTGIGADGIVCGPLPAGDGCFGMQFFNPDGSEAEKSGNGLRIFARYLWDMGLTADSRCCISINGERLRAEKLDETGGDIRMEMGQISLETIRVELDGKEAEATAVSIGNPHCVLSGQKLTRIHTIGPQLETDPQFPQRTNVQLLQIIDRHTIQIEIWERGAGYTRASGSSSCAAAGAAIWQGSCRSPVTVRMAGGTAVVQIDAGWQAALVGTVTPLFNGDLSPSFLKQLQTLRS